MAPPYDADPAPVWICVDPGIVGTGYAVFNQLDLTPTHFGVLVAKGNGAEWMERVRGIATQFSQILKRHKPGQVILEFQELYPGATSMTSGFRGDLFKLSLATGAMCCVSWEYTGQTPILKRPREWKGQLPKDIVELRVKKHYEKAGLAFPHIPNHAMDAVGMGFAQRGLL